MPTYQYSCTDCGHFFEQFQSFSEDSLTECPECEGRLRKVFNAVGVVFKGSGFYRTDSRTDSRTDGHAETGKAAGGTSGGDAKPTTEGAAASASKSDSVADGSSSKSTSTTSGSAA